MTLGNKFWPRGNSSKSRLKRLVFLAGHFTLIYWFTRTARQKSQPRGINVAFVRGGHYGIEAVDFLLKHAFPGETITYMSLTERVRYARVDLVVEGPPTFANKHSGCAPKHIPWIQYVAEPGGYYNNRAWCRHTHTPVVRMDTSLRHMSDVHPATVFLWTPYACKAIVELNLQAKLASCRSSSVALPVKNRTRTIAWMSQNCVQHRLSLWRELALHEDTLSGKVVLHALGKCAHNVNFTVIDRSLGWHNSIEVYKNYRFVLAIENTFEPGYVSEKLVTAIASGAIPIYFGDQHAAEMIFNKRAFIDAGMFFVRDDDDASSWLSEQLHWRSVAKKVLDINRNVTMLQNYAQEIPYPVTQQERRRSRRYFPNVPFPPTCLSSESATDFDEPTKRAFHGIQVKLCAKFSFKTCTTQR